jgi:hypothetical protein
MGPELETTFYRGAIPASEGALFTVPAGETWIVDSILVTNTSSSTSDTYTLDVVPGGSSASAATKLADAVTAAANAVGFVPPAAAQRLGLCFKPGDSLEGVQSAAGNFNIYVSGRVQQH